MRFIIFPVIKSNNPYFLHVGMHVISIHTLKVKRNLSLFRSSLSKIHRIKKKKSYLDTDKLEFSLWSTSEKQKTKGCLCQKGENCSEIVKGHLKKDHRNWTISTKSCLFRTFNSYSFNLNSGLCNHLTGFRLRRTPNPVGDQILWFKKNYHMRFHCIFLLFGTI